VNGKPAGPPTSLRDASAFVQAVRRWRARDWLAFNGCLAAAAAIGYLHFTSPPPDVSSEAYDRIALGMTWREVHGVVGARTGGYGPYWGPGRVLSAEVGTAVRWDWWGSPDGILGVGYDADGRACAKRLEHHPDRPASHPAEWPWWRRLWDRTLPAAEPSAIYSPF
jgi:hypothetical protein